MSLSFLSHEQLRAVTKEQYRLGRITLMLGYCLLVLMTLIYCGAYPSYTFMLQYLYPVHMLYQSWILHVHVISCLLMWIAGSICYLTAPTYADTYNPLAFLLHKMRPWFACRSKTELHRYSGKAFVFTVCVGVIPSSLVMCFRAHAAYWYAIVFAENIHLTISVAFHTWHGWKAITTIPKDILNHEKHMLFSITQSFTILYIRVFIWILIQFFSSSSIFFSATIIHIPTEYLYSIAHIVMIPYVIYLNVFSVDKTRLTNPTLSISFTFYCIAFYYLLKMCQCLPKTWLENFY
jgi:hypothetical protein